MKTETELQEYFENLVGHRFNRVNKIIKHLEDDFKGSSITSTYRDHEEDDFLNHDYEIMFEIKYAEDELIDLTLFFLYDRKRMMFITEVGFETIRR